MYSVLPSKPAPLAAIPTSLAYGADALMSSAGIPGGAILQMERSGPSRAVALGFADLARGQEWSLETASRLYSGTKVVTASAIMKLVEQNRISLETDVRELLPEFPLKYATTIRQLASHTSGLPDTMRAFAAIHAPRERQPSTREALEGFGLSKGRKSRRRARYRNVNYALLAEVVSLMAGTSFEDFVRTALLGPWRSSAEFSVSAFAPDTLARGYARRLDPMRLVAPWLLGEQGRRLFGSRDGRYLPLRPFDLNCAGIGGLVGTLTDFAPIIAEFLSPSDGALSAGSKRQMLSKQAAGKVGVISDRGVGLAWKLGQVDGIDYWNHEGGGPGYCSELRLYPAQGMGFVILFNLSQSRALSKVAHQICELLRRGS
jgi:CubicO group peptidase (beta-lactamase class C family)